MAKRKEYPRPCKKEYDLSLEFLLELKPKHFARNVKYDDVWEWLEMGEGKKYIANAFRDYFWTIDNIGFRRRKLGYYEIGINVSAHVNCFTDVPSGDDVYNSFCFTQPEFLMEAISPTILEYQINSCD